MKKGKLILLAGLGALLMTVGSWTPTASQANESNTVIAYGDVQKYSIPTILPPL